MDLFCTQKAKSLRLGFSLQCFTTLNKWETLILQPGVLPQCHQRTHSTTRVSASCHNGCDRMRRVLGELCGVSPSCVVLRNTGEGRLQRSSVSLDTSRVETQFWERHGRTRTHTSTHVEDRFCAKDVYQRMFIIANSTNVHRDNRGASGLSAVCF